MNENPISCYFLLIPYRMLRVKNAILCAQVSNFVRVGESLNETFGIPGATRAHLGPVLLLISKDNPLPSIRLFICSIKSNYHQQNPITITLSLDAWLLIINVPWWNFLYLKLGKNRKVIRRTNWFLTDFDNELILNQNRLKAVTKQLQMPYRIV